MASISKSNEPLIWGELQIRLPKKLLEASNEAMDNHDETYFKKIVPLCGEKFVVGRADGCNYQLMKKMVSSHHCYFKQESGNVYVVDTSRNGTFINRTKKISHGEYHILKDNDEIYLISKKGDPHTDFCLIYKSQTNSAPSNNAFSNNSEEPNGKRIKLEPDDGLSQTRVGQEPSIKKRPSDTDSDNEVPRLNPNVYDRNLTTNANKAIFTKKSPKTPTNLASQNESDSDSTIPNEYTLTPKTNTTNNYLRAPSDSDSADTLPLDVPSETIDISDTIEEESVTASVSTINQILHYSFDELPDIDESSTIPSVLIRSPSVINTELRINEHPDIDSGSHEESVTGPSVSISLRVKKELMELSELTLPNLPSVINITDATDDSSDKDESRESSIAAKKPDLPKKDGMEEALQCSLCIDILYEPVCLQPCLHCYCAGCFSQWMEKSSGCPQCRVFVESVAKNHIVSNMVEEYLKANPEKKRNEGEIKRLNELNVITQDVMKFSKQDEKVPDYDDEDSFSDSSRDSDDFSLQLPGLILRLPSAFGSTQRCRQCSDPTDKGKKGRNGCKKGAKNKCNASVDSAQPSTSTSASNTDLANKGKTNYTCPATQVHISCQCCQQLMPDRSGQRILDNLIPPQKCCQCFSSYCNLYFDGGCVLPSCKGCLVFFKDLRFNDLDLVRAINNNAVESRILLDYLTSRNQNWKDCFLECLSNLDSGKYNLVPAVNSKSIICYDCALRQLKNLLYTYRKQIPSTLLPQEVQQRPNCYWGRNCRTQMHKMIHAERFNHICEQTRFNR